MMKPIFSLLCLMACFCPLAESPKETKSRVDALKTAIPYPKFNLGDTLYIVFINDPEVATDRVRTQDVDVLKVRIVNMSLVSSTYGYNYAEGLLLMDSLDEFPPRWKYQYLDTSLPNPKYGDRSDFYDEERFFRDASSAISSLVN